MAKLPAGKATADSTGVMIGKSLKTGVKSALKSAFGKGLAGKAANAMKEKQGKTKKAIENS